jgi:hypothetical protein
MRGSKNEIGAAVAVMDERPAQKLSWRRRPAREGCKEEQQSAIPVRKEKGHDVRTPRDILKAFISLGARFYESAKSVVKQ